MYVASLRTLLSYEETIANRVFHEYHGCLKPRSAKRRLSNITTLTLPPPDLSLRGTYGVKTPMSQIVKDAREALDVVVSVTEKADKLIRLASPDKILISGPYNRADGDRQDEAD
jgi:hypothetical protein